MSAWNQRSKKMAVYDCSEAGRNLILYAPLSHSYFSCVLQSLLSNCVQLLAVHSGEVGVGRGGMECPQFLGTDHLCIIFLTFWNIRHSNITFYCVPPTQKIPTTSLVAQVSWSMLQSSLQCQLEGYGMFSTRVGSYGGNGGYDIFRYVRL